MAYMISLKSSLFCTNEAGRKDINKGKIKTKSTKLGPHPIFGTIKIVNLLTCGTDDSIPL